MNPLETRIYVFTGFLESGKTTFLVDTVCNTNFCDGEKTVIVLCEEGFVSVDPKEVAKHDAYVESVETLEELTTEYFTMLRNKYHPTQVLLEYNGMWNIDDLLKVELPNRWDIVQILTTIDASTFNLYVQNNGLRSLLYQHCYKSDLIIINRFNKKFMRKSMFRNNFKAMNPVAQLIYENIDGTINNDPDESLPYDYKQKNLDIADHDFGIFCYDVMENAPRYANKHVKLKGKFIARDKIIPNAFILGRYAMVCCEQDTSLIGIICRSEYANQLIPDEWVIVEGTTSLEYDEETGGNIIILNVEHLEGTPPLAYEYVTFD
ncbi:MAG: hypothetical protein J6P61_00160 [Erysipelotrichaceae bacterium]|nr:hypothetical protein [Erysipelotrichaceae bacterium]